jgi:hypothetical protein
VKINRCVQVMITANRPQIRILRHQLGLLADFQVETNISAYCTHTHFAPIKSPIVADFG